MAEGLLIYGRMGLGQNKRRNLDIKLLLTIVNHLVGPVHRAERHGKRAT